MLLTLFALAGCKRSLLPLSATIIFDKRYEAFSEWYTEMAQVRAAYDFDAQPGSGELSIKEGEVLTIIRQVISKTFLP